LVPLTGWLPVPLPSQIRCMTVPGGRITHFEISPCKQLLIIARKTGDPELWHIMGNRYIGSFKGENLKNIFFSQFHNVKEILAKFNATSFYFLFPIWFSIQNYYAYKIRNKLVSDFISLSQLSTLIENI
jgi:hypothetical protein